MLWDSKMDDKEFIKRLRRLAKNNGVEYKFDRKRGKGSHGTVHYGDRKSTLKKGELSEGLLNGMLKQLGINKEEF